MPLLLNDNPNPQAIMLGSQHLRKIMLGGDVVWQKHRAKPSTVQDVTLETLVHKGVKLTATNDNGHLHFPMFFPAFLRDDWQSYKDRLTFIGDAELSLQTIDGMLEADVVKSDMQFPMFFFDRTPLPQGYDFRRKCTFNANLPAELILETIDGLLTAEVRNGKDMYFPMVFPTNKPTSRSEFFNRLTFIAKREEDGLDYLDFLQDFPVNAYNPNTNFIQDFEIICVPPLTYDPEKDFIVYFDVNAYNPDTDFIQDFSVNAYDPDKDFIQDFGLVVITSHDFCTDFSINAYNPDTDFIKDFSINIYDSKKDFIKDFPINAYDPTKDFIKDCSINAYNSQKDFITDFHINAYNPAKDFIKDCATNAYNPQKDFIKDFPVNAYNPTKDFIKDCPVNVFKTDYYDKTFTVSTIKTVEYTKDFTIPAIRLADYKTDFTVPAFIFQDMKKDFTISAGLFSTIGIIWLHTVDDNFTILGIYNLPSTLPQKNDRLLRYSGIMPMSKPHQWYTGITATDVRNDIVQRVGTATLKEKSIVWTQNYFPTPTYPRVNIAQELGQIQCLVVVSRGGSHTSLTEPHYSVNVSVAIGSDQYGKGGTSWNTSIITM